jgi:hypothetical protein
MPPIRNILRPSLKRDRNKKAYRSQVSYARIAYFVAVNGSVKAPRIGFYWLSDGGSADSNGNRTYPNPYQLPMRPGATFLPRPQWKAYIKTINGQDYIDGMDFSDMQRAGFDPTQTNLLDPARQYKSLDWITNLKSSPRGDDTVQVEPGLYEKADGTFGIYQGSSPDHIDILTTYTPADPDDSTIVIVWLDTYTNTISVTQSSEFTQSATIYKPSESLPYLNEAAINRPPDAIGTQAYLVNGDATVMDFTSIMQDVRSFLHGNDTKGWPYVLDRNTRIWPNRQQIIKGQQTIQDDKQLTIQASGQLVVIT